MPRYVACNVRGQCATLRVSRRLYVARHVGGHLSPSESMALCFSKRVIRKTDSIIKEKRGDVTPPITSTVRAAYVKPIVIQEIKLHTIKLEPFSADIETLSKYWEQFES